MIATVLQIENINKRSYKKKIQKEIVELKSKQKFIREAQQ